MSHQPQPTRSLVVPLTLFRNRSRRRGEAVELPLVEVFGRGPRRRLEERGVPAFSVARHNPGDAIRRFHALVLAFDLDSDQAFQLDRALRGRAFVLWTAFDHREDGADTYRFRVLFPVSRPVNAHDHAVLAQLVDSDLGSIADRRAERRDRRWCLPVCPPCREEFASVRYGDGAVLDVDELLGYRELPSEQRTAC